MPFVEDVTSSSTKLSSCSPEASEQLTIVCHVVVGANSNRIPLTIDLDHVSVKRGHTLHLNVAPTQVIYT